MQFKTVAELEGSAFKPRVTIIGSGPAGLSLAMRLEEKNVPCLVIEAGGMDYSVASQDFYRGKVIGDAYFELHQARLRQFGGTSGHWTGWCRARDAADFEPRADVPHSGWPIRKADLDPYAEATRTLLQINPVAPDRELTPQMKLVEFAFSPPVRFGQVYRERIVRSPMIGLLLDTAVREIVPGAGRIDAIRVVGVDHVERDLRVEQLAVCTGGIENSRLLLWSNLRHGGRVVPHAATLGRFWMEHPNFAIGDAVMFGRPELPPRPYFAPTVRATRALGIGGAHVWLRPLDDDGDFKDLLREGMCVAPDLFGRLFKAAGRELFCGQHVRMEWEQWPRADNRIELGNETDALGVPRLNLHWSKAPAERKTVEVVTRLFGEALVARDLGRLRIRRWLLEGTPYSDRDQLAGWHHMGGTRMAESSEQGIVDRDCKVFGMSNLYIGGSSVFTTGGDANPTYTIVQLALRLAEHLAGGLASG